MNPKETGSKLLKHVKEMKDQAQKLGKEASDTAHTVKDAVKAGVEKTMSKEILSKGLNATAKGAKTVAQGAHLASRGVETLAKTMEKASQKVGALNDKIKKK